MTLLLQGALTYRAQAASASDFYRGKTVTLLTGFPSGGGYDVYLRLLAPYLSSHIPGKPNVIVQNMPGAGGLVAMNYFYDVAPRNGTYVIMPDNHSVTPQILGWTGVKYNIRKFQWIGGMAKLSNVLVVNKSAGVPSMKEAKSKKVLMAASGKSSESYFVPFLLNKFVGTKFDVVSGYPGTPAMFLSMKRGETQGTVAFLETINNAFPRAIQQGKLIVLGQEGQTRNKKLKQIPLYQEFISNREEKQVIELISAPGVMSRVLAAPPDTPIERVQALRTAFSEAMADSKFIKAAGRAHLEIDPVSYKAVNAAVDRMFSISSNVVSKAKKLLSFIGR